MQTSTSEWLPALRRVAAKHGLDLSQTRDRGAALARLQREDHAAFKTYATAPDRRPRRRARSDRGEGV